MSKVTIRNETKVPDALLREIVAFAKPPGKWLADLRVAHGNNHGVASRWRATVWIRPACWTGWRRPVKWAKGGGYQGNVVFGQAEALVDLIAHELRHCQRGHQSVRQFRPRGGRRRGRAASEADCDIYAKRMLRRWRRRGIPAANARLAIPRRPKPAPPKPSAAEEGERAVACERAKLLASRKRWLARAKRTITALGKIEKRLARLEKTAREIVCTNAPNGAL